jgi:hypothetical protein
MNQEKRMKTLYARKWKILLSVLGLTIAIVPATLIGGPPTSASTDKTVKPLATSATKPALGVEKSYGNLPLNFEPNHGQADSRVKFMSRGSGYALFLSATDAWLALNGNAETASMMRMTVVGANRKATVSGEKQLTAKSNYLIGDKRNWKSDLPNYKAVRVNEVYPGIDLLYYGTDQRRLEYDFVLKPGAEPKTIRLSFAGAESIRVDDDGTLRLATKEGEVVQPAPVIYQERNGERITIEGRYLLSQTEVSFEIEDYDRGQTLIIDPRIVYASFHGGSGDDFGNDITVDSKGNAYIAGTTTSSDLNLRNSFQGSLKGDRDIFIAKINSSGTELVYSTYLGGSKNDSGDAIAVLSDGKAVVGGSSDNTNNDGDYPVTESAYQDNGFGLGDGGADAVLTVLTPTGNDVTYSTYFRGRNNGDVVQDLAIDGTNKIYALGMTLSGNTPTKNAFASSIYAPSGFVAKFDPTKKGNDSLIYASRFGARDGRVDTEGIAVTSAGVAFLTGSTSTPHFDTTSNSSLPPFQTSLRGERDAFLMKVSPSGSLIYSTYFGGDGEDEALAIAVDSNERAYVTGFTTSSAGTFPLKNAFDTSRAGEEDAFVAKFNADGTALFYSSFISGGDFITKGKGIDVDSLGNAYVASGVAPVAAVPEVNGFPEDVIPGNLFLVKIGPSNATGTNTPEVLFSDSIRLGNPEALVLDRRGNILIAGTTGVSSAEVTSGAFQEIFGGGPNDSFVIKISALSSDSIGVFRPGTSQFLLRNTNNAGQPDLISTFGQAGDLPVKGDWDGDGRDEPGVFRPSTGQFLLRKPVIINLNPCLGCLPIISDTTTVNFGRKGDLPVSGDWNGDGVDTIGVFRPDTVGTFLLTNSIVNNSSPLADEVFSFGVAGDLPVGGDWNGDSIDTVGIFRPGAPGGFFLANSFANFADIFFNFGTTGDLPLAGDWTGKGNDSVGIFRPGKQTMFLANNFVNVADIVFVFGQQGDQPVGGDWDGK